MSIYQVKCEGTHHFFFLIAKNGETAGVGKKIKLRVESVKHYPHKSISVQIINLVNQFIKRHCFPSGQSLIDREVYNLKKKKTKTTSYSF